MIIEKHLEIKGLKTAFLIKAVEKPLATVIFIHGFPFSKETWNGQLEALPAQIQGIAYDVRGQGKSSAGHGFFSIDLFASDLLQFIDELKIEGKIILCGLSMGGYIALRVLELSKNIQGLILCDTNSESDSNEGKLNRFKSIEKLQSGGKVDFIDEFIKKVFNEKTRIDKPEIVSATREIMLANSEATISATQLALASRTETSAILKTISIPTLIIRGEADKLMTEKQAQFLTSEITGSELRIISDSAHLPNLENKVQFNDCLNNFLAKHFLS